MFRTKLTITVALILALTLGVAGVGGLNQPGRAEARPAAAVQDKLRPEGRRERPGVRRPERAAVRGVLKAVDVAKGTITVTVGEGRQEPAEKTFTVSKKAEVALGMGGFGRRSVGVVHEGKLADLVPGALVLLELSADQKAVESILADGPTLRGLIKGVDGGKNTITVLVTAHAGRRERGEAPVEEERTYTLARKADIGVDDGRGRLFSIKEAKLTDLPAGAVASLKLAADMQHVQVVVAEGPTVRGTVKAVDAGKKQIRLLTPARVRGEDPEEKTYAVDAGAVVLLDDGRGRRFAVKEGKLVDVPAGAVVQVKLAVDQKTATLIQAEGPTVGGTVKTVDASRGTITLVLRAARGDTPAEEKTFTVAKGARILIDGKEGKLADLKGDEETPVSLRLSLDQKTVQGIMAGGRGGRRGGSR